MVGLTSYWWNDLVQQFHTGAFPDLLDDGPSAPHWPAQSFLVEKRAVDTIHVMFVYHWNEFISSFPSYNKL